MVGDGCKRLEMDDQFLEMTVDDCKWPTNGWKRMKLAANGWKRMKLAANGWKFLEIAQIGWEMAGND